MSSKATQVASKSSILSNIFTKENFKYLFTTHFWGPVSNFGIPLAAIADFKKDPDLISGPMTGSLILYSAIFMRYSVAISPKNYLLFGCHFINEASQLNQGYRWLKHNYWSEKAAGAADAAPAAIEAKKD